MNSIEEFLNCEPGQTCFLYSPKRSILAKNPIATFSSDDDIKGFREFCRKHQQHKLIGYLAYDLAYQLFNIRQQTKNDLKLPKIHFYAFESWQEFSDNEIKKIPDLSKYKSQNFQSTISKEEYRQAYKKIKEYIKAGDIYQINLSHRLEGQSQAPARELFVKTLSENPVEHAAYIEGADFEILSASPERFIKISEGKIETNPVKGTRPRGKTPEEDQKMVKELIESEKEAAELNMITDLLRNDTGKVAKIGSVKVEGHRLLSKCPTVWHTYSKISGKLATSPVEALISMFPGGSITGCPKKRAIEIIDEVENHSRGVYTGAIGYIDNDKLDFNIAIRTIIKKGKKLYLQVGGGIVIDSEEKAELDETLEKAKSFMKILC